MLEEQSKRESGAQGLVHIKDKQGHLKRRWGIYRQKGKSVWGKLC